MVFQSYDIFIRTLSDLHVFPFLCLVTADLPVSLHCRGTFLQIHALDQCVFAIFFLHIQNCLLDLLFFSAFFLFFLLFLIFLLIIREKIHLFVGLLLHDILFPLKVRRHNCDTADQQIRIDDPVIQRKHTFHDPFGGRSRLLSI